MSAATEHLRISRVRGILAALLSLGIHVVLLVLAVEHRVWLGVKPVLPPEETSLVLLTVKPQPGPPPPAESEPAPQTAPRLPTNASARVVERQPATMAAPPPPTAQEWAFAASYTLKNSKGYRHSWGRQVRSMMGTAVEGADQGKVRFRVEIAPDGTLAKLETLWSTSAVAEARARHAIGAMPPLPPTPTGKPLVFERTISFSPFATDDTPSYKDDCLPDPPVFRNPFVWDGKSPQRQAVAPPAEKQDPHALEECLKQLPQDSLEAESARDQRLLDQGRSSKLGR